MADAATIYKVATLCLLKESTVPLSNTQVCNFFLDGQYTEYFNVQTALMELQLSHLITPQSEQGTTRYTLTNEGQESLRQLADKITPGMREDIRTFLTDHAIEIRQTGNTYANYCKAVGEGYLVHCKVMDGDDIILDVTLKASDQKQAEKICTNFRAKYQDGYAAFVNAMTE